MPSRGSEDPRSSSSKSGSTERSSDTSSSDKKSKESGSTGSEESRKSKSESPDGKNAVNIRIGSKKKRRRSRSSGSSKSSGGVVSKAAGAFATAVVKEVPKLFEKSENKDESDTRSTARAPKKEPEDPKKELDDPKKSGSPPVRDDKRKAKDDSKPSKLSIFAKKGSNARGKDDPKKRKFSIPKHRESRASREEDDSYYSSRSAQEREKPITTHQQTVGPYPQLIFCPKCNTMVHTYVMHESNFLTHLFAVVLCVIAGVVCACWWPYCINSCKTKNHYCPNCFIYFGANK